MICARGLRLGAAIVYRIVVPDLLLIPVEGVVIRIRSLRPSPVIGSHVHLHILLLEPARVMIDIDNRRLEPGTNDRFNVPHLLLGTRVDEGVPFCNLLVELFERMLVLNDNLGLIPTSS